MRKILLIIVIVLLFVLGLTSVINGIQIGDFKISSIKDIQEGSKTLDNKIKELNTSIDSTYPNKRQELTEASKKMQSTREEYLNEINGSSNEDLESALEIKNYEIERLWARIGNHAIDEGVNMTLDIKPGSSSETRNLEFTVKGTYLGQINFLYAIEDDEELNFRIYNYKLLPSSGTLLNATFLIKDVRITNSLNESLNNEGNQGSKSSTTEDTKAKTTPTPASETSTNQTSNAKQVTTPTPTPTSTSNNR